MERAVLTILVFIILNVHVQTCMFGMLQRRNVYAQQVTDILAPEVDTLEDRGLLAEGNILSVTAKVDIVGVEVVVKRHLSEVFLVAIIWDMDVYVLKMEQIFQNVAVYGLVIKIRDVIRYLTIVGDAAMLVLDANKFLGCF